MKKYDIINVVLLDTGFESKLYEDTLAEISRLEADLDFLRIFQKLIGPRAKSARRGNSSPVKKSKKKIGRPTNAEKAAREKREARAVAKV